MQPYLGLVQKILKEGQERQDRTGVGILGIFGHQSRYDLKRGFPLVTTKKCHFPSIVGELLWMIRGQTNTAPLREMGVTIWDEWADESGELGRIYGAQWRDWRRPDGSSVDQLAQLVEGLKTDPTSRRHLLLAWNPGELSQMALPPCHVLAQFYVAQETLSCQLYQRSADVFLGVPFNIASYSLLTMMLAQVLGWAPGEFIHTLGDAHLYSNHLDQVRLQLTRSPYPLPQLHLNPKVKGLFEFTPQDITLENYTHHPRIVAPVAV